MAISLAFYKLFILLKIPSALDSTFIQQALFNGEKLNTHHVVAVKDGGMDRVENLVHLHHTCHQHLHLGKRSKGRELEPDDG